MKKVIKLLLPVILIAALLGSINVSALSGINQYEQKLLDYIKNDFKMGQTTYEVAAKYQTYAYNYLNRDDVELTKEQGEAAYAELVDLWQKGAKVKTQSMATMTDAQKADMLKEVQDVADIIGLKATANFATNTLYLTDKYGKVVADNTAEIKQTGASSGVIAAGVVALSAVLGAAYVLDSKKVND